MPQNGEVKKKVREYSEEIKEAVLEEAGRTTILAAAEAWGIPHGTIAYWQARRRRRAREEAQATVVAEPGGRSREQGLPEEASCGAAPTAAKTLLKPGRPGHARRYSPAEIAHVLEYANQHGVAATTRALGPAKETIKRWRGRVQRAAAGKGDDPTSGPDPADIEAQRDREILAEWRKHPGLGPSQIRNQLRRKGIKTSVNTVRRIMEESGYRPPKVKSSNHDERFEATRPNHLWHMDFTVRFINRAKTFSLFIIDDYSRFVVGHAVSESEQADVVISAFNEAVQRYGKPEYVMTDRGSAFHSWRGIGRFTSLLTELGIDQHVVEDKEHNGKCEIFNANIAKECFDKKHFYSIAEMRQHLKSHLHFYNHGRTHHALGGMLVPGDRYYGRGDEVMALIEAGAGREQSLDTLDLRHRCLELFKVTSTDGRPAVFLMGQQIL
jgi:transposase InsO family protein